MTPLFMGYRKGIVYLGAALTLALGQTGTARATTCANAITINPANLPITNQALVCGASNDIHSGNVANTCGSTLYMGGQEALYVFTPTATNNYEVSYNGQSWSGIFVYADACPTAGGSCVANVTGSESAKALTVSMQAGATYYIWFDTWPSPNSPCPGTFTIQPQAPPPGCGEAFHDQGGPSGNYPANSDWVQTYCADNPGDAVTLLFSSFQTENGWDFLYIYNGPSTASPLLGTYSGNSLPPTFTSSHPGGCLTIRFTSDGSVNYAGWSGTILCGPLPAGDCVYALSMTDSGNNGWGASKVGVRINGGAWTYYTVTASMNMVLIGVMLGDLVEFNYDASGPNQNQNRYTIGKLGQAPYFTSTQPPVAGTTFSQIVNCGPPPAPPQDCGGGVTVCSAMSFTSNATDWGLTQDLNPGNQGCLSTENMGTWYFFSPQTATTIGFSISPQNPNDDYDFAVWGPYTQAQCPTGPPLRCSWNAPPSYVVGLGNGATDLTEGAGGDGWVKTIDALAGEVYVLYVDNWSSSGQAFTLNWDIPGNSSLDCTTLPVELLDLDAMANGQVIDVLWATATERDARHYEVQRSGDNERYTTIGIVGAAGNAAQRTDYLFTDPDPMPGINYYRLNQVDMDGTEALTHAVLAHMAVENGARPWVYPNPAEDLIHVVYHSPVDGGSRLYLLDATGRIVAGTNLPHGRGEVNTTLPVAHLAKGWYNLHITLPNGTTMQAGGFVKQ